MLVDRPVDITVARMWRGLSHWEKVRLGWVLIKEVFSLPGADELSELIENMRGSDALTQVAICPRTPPRRVLFRCATV